MLVASRYRSWIYLFSFLIFSQSQLTQADEAKQAVIDEYFIVLKHKPAEPGEVQYQKNKQSLNSLQAELVKGNAKILDSFMHAFVGLHVRMPFSELSQIMNNNDVAFVERNAEVKLFEQELAVRSWGLDRVDQRDLPLDQNYKTPYLGEAVHSYIIDTGIRSTHQEFVGRIGKGFSALENDASTEDCNGHGTHVVATVAGATAGVALQTIVHPVRVFSCSGGSSWNTIIKAIDWVIANHKKPANINMSLGGGANQAIDTAVENAVKAGVSVVVAAGNSNADACQSSPARAPSAITVAASSNNDRRASFSNWGACVDLFAPGQNIVSAAHTGDDQYRSLSGTSMASPHVAGAVSLVQGVYPQWGANKIVEILLGSATAEKIQDAKESPNLLLYVNDLGGVPTVDAGKDLILRLPVVRAVLKGIAKDNDGYIVETTWTQVSGPGLELKPVSFAWQQNLILSGLVAGEYVFRFTAKDDAGLTASDEVRVLVSAENIPPVANAGDNRKINLGMSISVSGQKSFDPDGDIETYKWSQKSGPQEAQIKNADKVKALITDLVPGHYVFSLIVTDNEGASSEDSFNVHVNQAPVVEAGDDQIIKLPKSSVILSGEASDPDGDSLMFWWKQETGPSQALIKSSKQKQTAVENLQEGTYVFRFTVKDQMNTKSSDTVKITVVNENSPPVVSAGEDIVIRYPQNSVTLKGSCEDSDGTCVSLAWEYKKNQAFHLRDTQLAGTGSELFLSDLEVGFYTFVLWGTDNKGASSFDEVRVTVQAANANELMSGF